MGDPIVRRATPEDAAALGVLIDGFAKGHPAEHHARSMNEQDARRFFRQPACGACFVGGEERDGDRLRRLARDQRCVLVRIWRCGPRALRSASSPWLGRRSLHHSCDLRRDPASGGCFLEASYDPMMASLRTGRRRKDRASLSRFSNRVRDTCHCGRKAGARDRPRTD